MCSIIRLTRALRGTLSLTENAYLATERNPVVFWQVFFCLKRVLAYLELEASTDHIMTGKMHQFV